MAHLPFGAFGNSGQVCLTLSRSYVHRSLFDAVLERLATAVRGFVIGVTWQAKTHLGQLITPRQLARIDSMVPDAVASGARVVTGGSIIVGSGNFFAPTIFTAVHNSPSIVYDEIFSPV